MGDDTYLAEAIACLEDAIRQGHRSAIINGAFRAAFIEQDYKTGFFLYALFEDTELKEEPDDICLERRMIVGGKKFVISSVFPKDAHLTPTDKLLSLIDKEQEAERNSF